MGFFPKKKTGFLLVEVLIASILAIGIGTIMLKTIKFYVSFSAKIREKENLKNLKLMFRKKIQEIRTLPNSFDKYFVKKEPHFTNEAILYCNKIYCSQNILVCTLISEKENIKINYDDLFDEIN